MSARALIIDVADRHGAARRRWRRKKRGERRALERTKWPCDVRARPEKTFVSIMGGKVSVPRQRVRRGDRAAPFEPTGPLYITQQGSILPPLP